MAVRRLCILFIKWEKIRLCALLVADLLKKRKGEVLTQEKCRPGAASGSAAPGDISDIIGRACSPPLFSVSDVCFQPGPGLCQKRETVPLPY